MRKWSLLLALLTASAFGAEIRNVDYACGPKDCSLRFQFTSGKNLPNFFQKYDAAAHRLTVGFSNTEARFVGVNAELSKTGLQNVNVFVDSSYRVPLLKFEFAVGPEISSDQNPVSLSKGKEFVISLPKTKSAAWNLQKLAAKSAKPESKADSIKAAKERLAAEKKAAAEEAANRKQAKADSIKAAKERIAAEKKAKAEEAANRKQAKADSIKAAKERLAAEKQAKADSIRELKEQSQKKVVSALIEGVKEMIGIQGNLVEQFSIRTESEISISDVKGPDKSSVLVVTIPGPKKTPMFNVSSSHIVKSVTWMSSGLRIQLQPNVHPMILTYKGALILQIPRAEKAPGFICYLARPEGVYVRKWADPSMNVQTFAEFSKDMDSDKKKIVNIAASFGLKPVSRSLIVVAESTPFLSSPSEKAQSLGMLDFGTRLEDLELNGLFYKVRYDSKVGYVNRRAVSFPDELSSRQSERLKQLAIDQGGTLDSNAISFDHPIEERVSYSSFGRRDPFVEVKGLMEDGINIDQVTLVGIIWESEVPIAILAESKNPEISYAVKEGDRILNGKVLKITQTEVLFLLQEFGVSRRYSMTLPDQYGSNAK